MKKKRKICLEIKAINNLIKRDIERTHPKEIEASVARHGFAIGYFYDNLGKDVFQRDFEEHFSIRRSTATGMLQLMEKKGLIIRENIEDDGRLKKIVLTQRAIDIHEKMIENMDAREERLTSGLTDAEISAFFDVIDKIKANLEDNND